MAKPDVTPDGTLLTCLYRRIGRRPREANGDSGVARRAKSMRNHHAALHVASCASTVTASNVCAILDAREARVTPAAPRCFYFLKIFRAARALNKRRRAQSCDKYQPQNLANRRRLNAPARQSCGETLCRQYRAPLPERCAIDGVVAYELAALILFAHAVIGILKCRARAALESQSGGSCARLLFPLPGPASIARRKMQQTNIDDGIMSTYRRRDA